MDFSISYQEASLSQPRLLVIEIVITIY